MTIDLSKIGFEYGRCKRETITGDISWFELEYTQVNGVQRIRFQDELRTYDLGYVIEGQAKVTKRYEFDDTKRWVGIHGLESAEGIEKLGIITLDSTCMPIGGQLLIESEEEEEEPVVVPDETDDTVVDEQEDETGE